MCPQFRKIVSRPKVGIFSRQDMFLSSSNDFYSNENKMFNSVPVAHSSYSSLPFGLLPYETGDDMMVCSFLILARNIDAAPNFLFNRLHIGFLTTQLRLP